jgi:hypothetical protein
MNNQVESNNITTPLISQEASDRYSSLKLIPKILQHNRELEERIKDLQFQIDRNLQAINNIQRGHDPSIPKRTKRKRFQASTLQIININWILEAFKKEREEQEVEEARNLTQEQSHRKE